MGRVLTGWVTWSKTVASPYPLPCLQKEGNGVHRIGERRIAGVGFCEVLRAVLPILTLTIIRTKTKALTCPCCSQGLHCQHSAHGSVFQKPVPLRKLLTTWALAQAHLAARPASLNSALRAPSRPCPQQSVPWPQSRSSFCYLPSEHMSPLFSHTH